MSRPLEFKHEVGDGVRVAPPLLWDSVWIKGVVVEQVVPYDYPKTSVPAGKLVCLPGSRKVGTPTRKESYLVRTSDENVWLWATRDCVRADA